MENSISPFFILWVVPGEESEKSMFFSRRQIDYLLKKNVAGKIFYLKSRSFPIALARAFIRFKKEIKKYNPSIIHSHYGSVNGLFASSFHSIPFVITFMGSDLNKTPSDGYLKDIVSRKSSRIAASRANKIICVSQNLKDLLPERLQHKTEIIPFGVNINQFVPSDKAKSREILGWDKQEKVVIFNANNPAIKQLDLAKATILKLKSVFPDIRLEILDGKKDPEIVPTLFNASDILLLCSKSEGSPMVIKEAMACNLPIVSTDVGDTSTRLNNVKGTKISNENVDDLAANIKYLLFNTIHSDGRNKLISDGLSEETVNQKLISLYNNIIKTR